MRKIVYTASDGSFCVVNPVINTHTLVDGDVLPAPENISEDEALDRARKDIPSDATDIAVVDDVPSDRTFRNAWKHDNGAVTVDMAKAVEIQKNKLREIRAPKLAALDAEYMKALESGDSAAMATIATKKQALRDVTKAPELASAKTPDELKSAIPSVLK